MNPIFSFINKIKEAFEAFKMIVFIFKSNVDNCYKDFKDKFTFEFISIFRSINKKI